MDQYESIECIQVCQSAGFWRCEQAALLASYNDTICRLEDRLSLASRDIYSTQQVSLSDGGQGRSGVALLDSKGTDAGLLAFGLARQMLKSGRYVRCCVLAFTSRSLEI